MTHELEHRISLSALQLVASTLSNNSEFKAKLEGIFKHHHDWYKVNNRTDSADYRTLREMAEGFGVNLEKL